MREIEFRGKIRDCDEWVYGSLVYIPFDDGSEYCCIMENNCDDEYLPYIDNNSGAFDGYMMPVDKETLGQYTGLTDKNGIKIFEGDIVNICYADALIEHCIVVFGDYGVFRDEWGDRYSTCGFALKFDDGSGYTNLTSKKHYMYDVVGNIHDNGDLINDN